VAVEDDASSVVGLDTSEDDVTSDEAEGLGLVAADISEDGSGEGADELTDRFLPTQAPSVKAITKVRAIVSAYVIRDWFFIA
jgi:hypothetical protein